MADPTKTLSKDKVKEIISKAPAGTKPEEIINGLVARGYTLEGFTPAADPFQKQQENPTIPDKGQEPKQPFVSKVADFLGIKKFGQGIATLFDRTSQKTANDIQTQDIQGSQKIIDAIHKETDPAKKAHLIDFLKKNYGQDYKAPTAEQLDPGLALSNKEVLGSAAMTALNIAGAGSLKGSGVTANLIKASPEASAALETLTNFVSKVAAPIKDTGVVSKIANAGIKGAEIGAMYGGATAATDNKTLKQSIGPTALTALFGGVISGGIQSASELLKYLSSANVTESLYNKALAINKNTELAGRSPSERLIAEGKITSKQGFIDWADQQIKTNGKEVDKILTKDLAGVNFGHSDVVDQIRKVLTDKYGDTLGDAGIQKLMDDLPIAKISSDPAGSITAKELNGLRSKIDSNFVGNRRWLNANLDPVKIDSYKTAANVMRGIIQKSDSRLPELFANMSDAFTTKNSLVDELAKPHILTNMFQMSRALGGAGAGLLFGGPLGAAIGGVTEVATEKALKSAPVLTGTAVALDRFGQWMEANGASKEAINTITRIVGKNAIAKFISSLSSYDTSASKSGDTTGQ